MSNTIPIYCVFNEDNLLLAAFTDADELHEYLFENEGNDFWVTTGTVPLPSDED